MQVCVLPSVRPVRGAAHWDLHCKGLDLMGRQDTETKKKPLKCVDLNFSFLSTYFSNIVLNWKADIKVLQKIGFH